MGQRHQVFLIARVNSKAHEKTPRKTRYYRCIAALHHQWCYGRLPLKAARRFLALAKQKDNAQIIREEVRNFDNATSLHVPCPYSLATAWTVDLTPGKEYNTNGHYESAQMGSGKGDNDDGITVFDVTDPENASYCFMTISRGVGSPHPFRPFNAEKYVRCYYPEPDREEALSADEKKQIDLTEKDVFATIAALDGAPLVTINKLAAAWPDEYQPRTTARRHEPAVNHALEVGEIEALEVLLDMPGKAALIKNALQKRISLPDGAIELVATLISLDSTLTPKELDLSQWAKLTSEQVVNLVSEQANIESLCLSQNQNVTKTTVLEVLSAKPTLRKLVLLDTSVTDSDMAELLTDNPKLFYSVEAIVHPLFLQWKNIRDRPVAFTHILCDNTRVTQPHACAVSLPYFTPGQIVQALTDLLGSLNNPRADYELSAGYAAQAAYASELRKEGCPWAERTVPICLDRLSPSLSDGWHLVWKVTDSFDSYHGRLKLKRYAFFRLLTNDLAGSVKGKNSNASITYDIHDLKSFIDILVSEGRPAPSHTALDNLLAAFSAEFTLLTEEEVAVLARSWPMGDPRFSPDYGKNNWSKEA